MLNAFRVRRPSASGPVRSPELRAYLLARHHARAEAVVRERTSAVLRLEPAGPDAAPPCVSCAAHPMAPGGGLCAGCLHAVECHGATLADALDVECDGKCGRFRRHFQPTDATESVVKTPQSKD